MNPDSPAIWTSLGPDACGPKGPASHLRALPRNICFGGSFNAGGSDYDRFCGSSSRLSTHAMPAANQWED